MYGFMEIASIRWVCYIKPFFGILSLRLKELDWAIFLKQNRKVGR